MQIERVFSNVYFICLILQAKEYLNKNVKERKSMLTSMFFWTERAAILL